jgi:hypothetical protein
VVVDDFDVVAVGVEHVRGVIASVVLRPLARVAVAAVSGRDRVRVEPTYFVLVAGEGDVDVPGRLPRQNGEGGV